MRAARPDAYWNTVGIPEPVLGRLARLGRLADPDPMTVEPGHRRAADTDRQVPPGTHIRLATDSDAERVAVTHVAAWRRGYAGQMPEALLAGLSVQERTGLWRMALA